LSYEDVCYFIVDIRSEKKDAIFEKSGNDINLSRTTFDGGKRRRRTRASWLFLGLLLRLEEAKHVCVEKGIWNLHFHMKGISYNSKKKALTIRPIQISLF
jgi:hypothetical protein